MNDRIAVEPGRYVMPVLQVLVTILWVLSAAPAAAAGCGDSGVVVQVLGSGGPVADDRRASAGYLVWVDGHARLLVDAGGGVFQRFGEAGASIEDLEAVLLTHLHTDHVTDLPAILKGGYFSDRRRPLPIMGPDGGGQFPSTQEFLDGLFNRERGVYRYLYGFLDGSDGLFATPVREIPAETRTPRLAFQGNDLRVDAVGVLHGPVPALAYRVAVGGVTVAFSGDQNDENPAFASLAEGVDLLIMAHAVPQDAGPVAKRLHATPEGIGRLAGEAQVGHLVLSHLMARSLRALDDGLPRIHARYPGRVTLADDLMCIAVPRR